jgi:hypothetical protein
MRHHPIFTIALLSLGLGGAITAWLLTLQGYTPEIWGGGNYISAPTKDKKYIKAKTAQPSTTFASSIVLGWDIMLSRDIGARNKKLGYDRTFASGTTHPLHDIIPCTQWRCLIFANLESQFSTRDNDKHERTFIFAANTGNIAVLDWLRRPWMVKKEGVVHTIATENWTEGTISKTEPNTLILALANNHVSNAWGAGMRTTRELLDNHNIYHVGAGNSATDARTPKHVVHKEISRCIGSYSYDGAWGVYGGGVPLYRNRIDQKTILADIATMRTTYQCDLIAIMLHRGTEYRMKPNAAQTQLAHTLINSGGVNLIIGSHPHVPQTIEKYKNAYIFYSLGNALFDQDRGRTSIWAGMSTIIDYSRTSKGTSTVPTYISIFPELLATKTSTGTTLSLTTVHTYTVTKWLYGILDEKTRSWLIQQIMPSHID